MGKGKGMYMVLVGKRKRSHGRPRHRWEDSIRADLQEVGCGGIDWTELAQEKGGGQL
jgi:hypothetical protein